MFRFNKKDLYTIPNIICYIRIILIPIFTYIYMSADTVNDYYIAAAIILFSSFTDLFDGMIARKFNQVSDLGKILDPIADKLTHFFIVICLCMRYRLMFYLLALMIFKELFMGIAGIISIKKGKMINGATFIGKVCTASLFIALFSLIIFVNMPLYLANIIIIILMIIMTYTLISYFILYYKLLKDK